MIIGLLKPALSGPLHQRREIAFSGPVHHRREPLFSGPVLRRREIAFSGPVLRRRKIAFSGPVLRRREFYRYQLIENNQLIKRDFLTSKPLTSIRQNGKIVGHRLK